MADIKDKIEMELKPFETMCETTTEHLKKMICSGEQANGEEILTVAKVLGEITDIKKDIVEMCYKKQILEAMEESDYGEDYDFRGKKPYSEPYKGGKMSPKYSEDFYKHRDMDYPKKMYYTETPKMKDAREGISGEMRKTYIESKSLHGADSDEMETLEEFFDALESDFMELYPSMTMAEKQMSRNKFQNMIGKIK